MPRLELPRSRAAQGPARAGLCALLLLAAGCTQPPASGAPDAARGPRGAPRSPDAGRPAGLQSAPLDLGARPPAPTAPDADAPAGPGSAPASPLAGTSPLGPFDCRVLARRGKGRAAPTLPNSPPTSAAPLIDRWQGQPPLTLWRRGTGGLAECWTQLAGPLPPASLLSLGSVAGQAQVWLAGERLASEDQVGRPLLVPLPDGAPAGAPLVLRVAWSAYSGGLLWRGPARAGPLSGAWPALLDPLRDLPGATTIPGAEAAPRWFRPSAAERGAVPLLVWLHGWGGSVHSCGPWSALFDEAERRGVALLFPPSRGNRLYVGASEQGVFEAIYTLVASGAIDPERVWISGASMGGAGALQLAYHRPDCFAAVAAFFGDSLYERKGYIGRLLPDARSAAAHSVLRFAENGLALPTLLVHGRDDAVSPVSQSLMLDARLKELGHLDHWLDAPAGFGHEAALVLHRLPAVLDWLAGRRRLRPRRLRYASNDPGPLPGAWGLHLLPDRPGRFARIDLERDGDTLLLHDLSAGRALLDLDALLGPHAASAVLRLAPGLSLARPRREERGLVELRAGRAWGGGSLPPPAVPPPAAATLAAPWLQPGCWSTAPIPPQEPETQPAGQPPQQGGTSP